MTLQIVYHKNRCSIVLQDHMQNNEVSSELRQTTEEIFKLNFFNKLAVVIEQVNLCDF